MDALVRMEVNSRPRAQPLQRTLLVLLPAAALFIFHASLYGSWLIDDAGISFAYARNLASGHGLVTQPGEIPVEGFSNPQWVFLIAVCYALKTFSIPLLPKLLGSILALASLSVFALVAQEITGPREAPVVGAMVALLTAANPGYVVWCVSGLENPLLVLLASVLLLVSLRALRAPEEDTRYPVHAGLLAAGLALTRPDAVVYGAFFPLALLVRRIGPIRMMLRPAVAYALSAGVPFGAYLAFRRLYFHDWFPNTYYAKAGVSLSGLSDLLQIDGVGFNKLVELSGGILPAAPVVIPIVFVAAAILGPRAEPRVRLLSAFTALPFVSFLILPRDWMGEYRFGTVAFPCTYLLALAVLCQLPLVGTGLRSKAVFVVGVSMLVLCTCSGQFLVRMQVRRDVPVCPLEKVAATGWKYNHLSQALGLQHPTLLTPDFGATLLLSRVRMVDLAGLCDRRFGRMWYARLARAQFAEYILTTLKPDLIDAHSFWLNWSGLDSDPRLATDYIDLKDGDYVRRASLPASMDEATARAIKARIPPLPSSEELRRALGISRSPVLGHSAF
jgi:hypothetical protein